jgi:tetratricopeptide (TPR) repeat protein
VEPQPVAEKPAEKPPVEKTVEKPVEKAPAVAKPQTPPPAPAPKPAAAPTQDVASRLAAGERALATSELAEARRVYHGLLETPGISRETLIRVAEGLYRSRDFEGALAAFGKIGTLRRGEEPYHYYIAVAHYEMGRYQQAKKALEAALPYIEVTPDVARYRAKIEGSIE